MSKRYYGNEIVKLPLQKNYIAEACKVFVVYPNNITASWLLAYIPTPKMLLAANKSTVQLYFVEHLHANIFSYALPSNTYAVGEMQVK